MQERWNQLKDELELIQQLRNKPSQAKIRTNFGKLGDISLFIVVCLSLKLYCFGKNNQLHLIHAVFLLQFATGQH